MKRKYDKYDLYQKAVQSAETDVVFLRDVYKQLRKKSPRSMREDFCGTFSLSCEWVKLNPKHVGIGIDLDPEPLEYGLMKHYPKLRSNQQSRLTILRDNVLSPKLPPADIVSAMNFSYFIFKSRQSLRAYFKNALRTLKKDGIFIIDLFGGSLCQAEIEEKSKKSGFTYYWHQKCFDPVSNFAKFAIHFKPDGQKKMVDQFTYDWRMWTIPELREMMTDVGFTKTHVYWEGTTRSGGGDGKFKMVEVGESCQSWIAYIAAEK